MLTLNDPIELDVLTVLFNTPEMRMQRYKIRDQLFPKYRKEYSEGSFDVVLQRRLDRLAPILEKEYVSRASFYSIRKKMKKKVEKMIKEKEFQSLIPSLDARWLVPLRNLLVKLNETQPYLEGFLNTNCITFVGDIPCTFHKSVEGIQSHIAFERSLQQRHERDLEKFREEFMNTRDKISMDRVDAKIKEEVGWSTSEYLKKLLKKAEKEEGIRKIMTVLGITDEMLEKMGYNERSVDPGVQKRLDGEGRS